MNNKLKAGIYRRVSTTEQAREGYSLDAQEKALRDWCERNGYEVYKSYADEGISGKDIEHRPQMKALLNDAYSKKFDIIVVWSLSRFTRSVADLYSVCEKLTRHGVGFCSMTESFSTSTPSGRAMMGMLGIFAQMEREITGERVRFAMQERAAQGKRTCGEVLGYDTDGKDTLKINEPEAERVRFIFENFIKFKNYSAVAKMCDLIGYRGKRGRVFQAEHIKKILTRPIYIGYYSFMGNKYKGDFEPVISERDFCRVQSIIANHGHKNKADRADMVKTDILQAY